MQHGAEHSLNVKGAYLELWSDMLGSLGVIVAAVVIYFTQWAGSTPSSPPASDFGCCRARGRY